MAVVQVRCPNCESENVTKYGRQPNGSQRYRCHNPGCSRQVFLMAYQSGRQLPEVKRQIIEMALYGNSVRETARTLSINPNDVAEVFERLDAFQWSPTMEPTGAMGGKSLRA